MMGQGLWYKFLRFKLDTPGGNLYTRYEPTEQLLTSQEELLAHG